MYRYLVLSRGRVFEEKEWLPSMFIPSDFQVLLYHSSATGSWVFGLRLDDTIGFFLCSVSVYQGVPKCHPDRTECSSCGLTMTFWFLETVLWHVSVGVWNMHMLGTVSCLFLPICVPWYSFVPSAGPWSTHISARCGTAVRHLIKLMHMWALTTGQLAATNLRLWKTSELSESKKE